MNKYYEIEVEALQNGYEVNARYRVIWKDGYDGYSSRSDKFVFVTWDEVIAFMNTNKLEVPPAYPVDAFEPAVTN